MTIVIPYIDNSLELKYALRSAEKHHPGCEVMIVGDRPGGLKNYWYVPATDTPGLIFKERNIFNKVLAAAELVPEFLFMNDDHFLLEPITENYYEGTVKEWLDRSQANSYQQTLRNTFEAIDNAPYFDIHCPIMMESRVVKKMSFCNWDKEFGYCFKSWYAHFAQLTGTHYTDLKFREPMTKENIKSLLRSRKFFSTGNRAVNNDMISVLEELYPEKSSFEK